MPEAEAVSSEGKKNDAKSLSWKEKNLGVEFKKRGSTVLLSSPFLCDMQ